MGSKVGVADELWLWLVLSKARDVCLKAFMWLGHSVTPHEFSSTIEPLRIS